MFDANKVAQGLDQVENIEHLVALLAKSVGYTYGDRFSLGNHKIGTSSVQPDEAHPDWEWQPITGSLYSMATVQVPTGSPIVLFATGTRLEDVTKNVLCIYTTDATVRSALAAKLADADGASTIGDKLADLLGYSDWAIVAGPSTSESNRYTYVAVTASGVSTSTGSWISPVSLILPDDGGHSYTTSYDPYSGLMLLNTSTALPGMIELYYNPTLGSSSLHMAKSTYDADFQNTMDVVHKALDNALADAMASISSIDGDVDGLTTANGALFAAISAIPVFGAKFVDVVSAWERIEDSSQYIPRP